MNEWTSLFQSSYEKAELTDEISLGSPAIFKSKDPLLSVPF
jgi:hypothetical protein